MYQDKRPKVLGILGFITILSIFTIMGALKVSDNKNLKNQNKEILDNASSVISTKEEKNCTKKQYRERTWDTCKYGSPDECTQEGVCSRSIETDGTEEDCFRKGGTISVYDQICIVNYKCCVEHQNTCQGGWNTWEEEKDGYCIEENSDIYECEEITSNDC